MKKEKYDIENATDVGLVRTINEDYYAIYNYGDDALFVVCDGMGGHKGGEHASRKGAEAINEYFRSLIPPYDIQVELKNTMLYANKQILKMAKENPELEGMGSTAVLILLRSKEAYVVHVGDSRAYLIRNGTILQLTKDHSFIQKLIDDHIITRQLAKVHPKKNLILQALGSNKAIKPEVSGPISLFKNDIFCICTDGLTNQIEDNEILQLGKEGSAQVTCSQLIDLAKSRGGTDNITLQIVRINEGIKYKDKMKSKSYLKSKLFTLSIAIYFSYCLFSRLFFMNEKLLTYY